MGDLPPPYEASDTSPLAVSVSQLSLQAQDLIDFQELHDASIPHDESPMISSRITTQSPDELPSFEDRGLHLSGASYFTLRPPASPSPTHIISHHITIKDNSNAHNVKFPDRPEPARTFTQRGVSINDWSTFLNFLFPIQDQAESNRKWNNPSEKRNRSSVELSTSSRGSAETVRGIYIAQSVQEHVRDVEQTVQKRVKMRAVIDEWNTYFFRPRGLLISAKFENLVSKAKSLPIPENESQPNGTTLYQAVIQNQINTVQSLLQRGADPNIKPSGRPSALYIAVTVRFDKMIKILLDAGANPEDKPPSAAPPLWFAASIANMEVVSLLLRYGANPDGHAPNGPTALYLASSRSDLPTMNLLLKYGADPGKTISGGYTPLYQAILSGSNSVISTLLPYLTADVVCKKTASGLSPIYAAASRGDFPGPLITQLLELGANPNDSPPGRPTALGDAAKRGDEAMVRRLLFNYKADPNKKPWGGASPLHSAACNGHSTIVKLLIEHNADVDESPASTPTALSQALGRHDTEIVSLLLNAGADPNRKVPGGQSPLYAAAERGEVETVRLLLSKGADPNSTQAGGHAALYKALEQKDNPMFRLLVEHPQTDVNKKGHNGMTPLWFAAQIGDVEAVTMLLKRGAGPDDFPPFKSTALAGAVEREDTRMVKVLLAGGADPTKKPWLGEGAMSAAVRKDNKEILRLFSSGAGGR